MQAHDPGQRPDGREPTRCRARDDRGRPLRRGRLALTSRRRSTASPICSSIWCSRAPAAARRASISRGDRGCRRRPQRLRPTRDPTSFTRRDPGRACAARRRADRRPGPRAAFRRRRARAREGASCCQELGEARDTPDDIIFDDLLDAAFAGQPLGRSVLGDEASIAAVTRRRSACAGGSPQYRAGAPDPGRARGKVEHERAGRAGRGSVRRHAGRRARRPPSRRASPAAARIDRRSRRAGASGASRFPGLPAGDPDYCRAVCSPTSSAAACRRGCSSSCARTAGWPIRSIAWLQPFADTGLFCIYCGDRPRQGRRGARS